MWAICAVAPDYLTSESGFFVIFHFFVHFAPCVYYRVWKHDENKPTIIERVKKAFSFKPADMERVLGLRKPIFRQTTNYGHFTKPNLPWEQLDEQKLAILRG